MIKFVTGARALIGVMIALFIVTGVVRGAETETLSEHDLRSLWAEARQGNAEAQYRLGRNHERRYWLRERNQEASGDRNDLVVAYALFRMAEKSGHLDALYGRHGTEYRLKQVLGDKALEAALETLPAWLRDGNSRLPGNRDAALPGAAAAPCADPAATEILGHGVTPRPENMPEKMSE